MIQDIFPHKFDNSYKNAVPDDDSYVFIFDEDKAFLRESNGLIKVPAYKSLKKVDNAIDKKLTYLFGIDEHKYYLLNDISSLEQYDLAEKNINIFRQLCDECDRFAGATAVHLYRWYYSNKYCGRCGQKARKHDNERAMYCPHCKNKVYPTISPVIMVGIINEDKLLMTRYARGSYRNYTLVAGYVEIGETFEEAVKREVMEEVGLKVKNIKYYKSQPWAFSGAIMTGFFAELDGSDEVTLEREELCEASWISRDDVVEAESTISISSDMISAFKENSFTLL